MNTNGHEWLRVLLMALLVPVVLLVVLVLWTGVRLCGCIFRQDNRMHQIKRNPENPVILSKKKERP